jgi:hypothetical protein
MPAAAAAESHQYFRNMSDDYNVAGGTYLHVGCKNGQK